MSGDLDDSPLLFADIIRALPDERHRSALLEMMATIGRMRRILDDPVARVRSRDAAIRAAVRDHYAGLDKTNASKKLAGDLSRYLKTSYPSLPESPSAKRRALRIVLDLNSGRALAWRRIFDVL